jgi:hypothetical protein
MGSCENCGGCTDCGSCGGCGKQLLLTQPEIDLLLLLGQIPFLPVARKASDMTPVFLEEGAPEDASAALVLLEKKLLIDIDYSKPLSGADMTAYQGLPVHGSFALTQRGQTVLELLQQQGIQD